MPLYYNDPQPISVDIFRARSLLSACVMKWLGTMFELMLAFTVSDNPVRRIDTVDHSNPVTSVPTPVSASVLVPAPVPNPVNVSLSDASDVSGVSEPMSVPMPVSVSVSSVSSASVSSVSVSSVPVSSVTAPMPVSAPVSSVCDSVCNSDISDAGDEDEDVDPVTASVVTDGTDLESTSSRSY